MSPSQVDWEEMPSDKRQQMMRGLCRYLIGRLVTLKWESQTG